MQAPNNARMASRSQSQVQYKYLQLLFGIHKDHDYNTKTATEYQVKKYLLLLATLVATVTYAAGLNVPGGSWLEDDLPEGHLAGDSILRDTSFRRYIVFYYFNAISFAASLMVGLLLLIVHQDGQSWGNWALLQLVRAVMLVDLLGLLGAYAVGSSHDRFTTVCGATVLASGVVAYAAVALVTKWFVTTAAAAADDDDQNKQESLQEAKAKGRKKEHEILLVLAIFAATIGYVAGLNPPGGFWRSSDDSEQAGHHHHHNAGEPVLQGLHRTRYRVFFYFNTTGFVASLLAIMLVVSFDKMKYEEQDRIPTGVRKLALFGPNVTALLGLAGAYAAGSCRDSRHTIYIVLVAASISLLLFVAQMIAKRMNSNSRANLPTKSESTSRRSGSTMNSSDETKALPYKNWAKTREDLQLLAILVATVAYTAGVDPPGGVWAETGHGHRVGDPILLTTHPVRYKVFFYCNSAALVASLAIMVMLQSDRLVRKHALEAVMILDLFALIGAFAAGGARDTSTSVYTVALAGAVLIYVVIHIVFFTLDTPAPPPPAEGGENHAVADEDPSTTPAPAAQKGEKKNVDEQRQEEKQLQKRRDVLLLLAILAATLTYQAGLTPPGGTWEEDGGGDSSSSSGGGHRAGFPVLLDKFPLRYKTFYYCNAASFMASVALIVLLLNQNLYKPGIRCYALYVCMVAGMLGLMGAYSAGSSLHLRTSIVVLVFASLLTVAAFAVAIYVKKRNDKKARIRQGDDDDDGGGQKRPKIKAKTNKAKRKDDGDAMTYLMLVGILGASVTYLTGLKPPGGTWRDDGDGHSAGSPVLYDTGKHRYNAFFYNNSASFMISINIIAWLLVRMIWGPRRKDDDEAATTATTTTAKTTASSVVVHLSPLYGAVVLDLVALLGAYAAGSARKWGTSTKVVVMLVPVLLVVWLVLFCCDKQTKDKPAATSQPAVTS
ncbi:hypothetical protein SORBI_3005G196500 [Sorghum bicolor]|uniref:PGG domain-containing protein n=2 Tax=Sorghum bicolor TaxID=4558 RepID=A0A1B6PTK4_SORBI|nr:hypothetical protein SORBI_3005G196500 [Sorghum bicolor]